ncbi:uncharacterized protein KNAG_0I01810 [Huiozyma naganishii CBS 8797]|uniref:Uncharacterized protein n=1 Tax=Huiozyma naganishii (strain ATCC MYA-139 / BCRC 22969 / CBS 8797 / KCTC 17520 / NBRC 10181 / NCYC 3082 / Yp74L-3) TaxID=1071383 RepID=J7SA95_HUIN7|nr:hypothetical protein KNAG_0I01810 [Kazachstania naganishii CBS 8797]CCK71966.1 hypothetical protein KNAG_0I01810 [Kazachstania naganishii CBS 8797]
METATCSRQYCHFFFFSLILFGICNRALFFAVPLSLAQEPNTQHRICQTRPRHTTCSSSPLAILSQRTVIDIYGICRKREIRGPASRPVPNRNHALLYLEPAEKACFYFGPHRSRFSARERRDVPSLSSAELGVSGVPGDGHALLRGHHHISTPVVCAFGMCNGPCEELIKGWQLSSLRMINSSM